MNKFTSATLIFRQKSSAHSVTLDIIFCHRLLASIGLRLKRVTIHARQSLEIFRTFELSRSSLVIQKKIYANYQKY